MPLVRLYLMILMVTLTFGCSIAGNRYTYVPSDPKEWQISRCEIYGGPCYGFKCGEYTYWVIPHIYRDIKWIGPFPFPYVFPFFLAGRDTNFDLMKFYLYANKDSTSESVDFVPLLKRPDGSTLRPSGCSTWKTAPSWGHKEVLCRYDALFWDLPSFTLSIDGQLSQCSPSPIEFIQAVKPFYDPIPTR